mmetsp:Transcript_29990/g.63604  ORF Transcript_29990/g.63604 Transcript_29990/m.63604 type:complete len:95 (-) Transcript_29990:1964-2248(-)
MTGTTPDSKECKLSLRECPARAPSLSLVYPSRVPSSGVSRCLFVSVAVVGGGDFGQQQQRIGLRFRELLHCFFLFFASCHSLDSVVLIASLLAS